jgi:hypothetical protein
MIEAVIEEEKIECSFRREDGPKFASKASRVTGLQGPYCTQRGRPREGAAKVVDGAKVCAR